MASTSRTLLRVGLNSPIHAPVAGPSTSVQVRHKSRASAIARYLERKDQRDERDALGLPRVRDQRFHDEPGTPTPAAREMARAPKMRTLSVEQLEHRAREKARQLLWREDLESLPAAEVDAWKKDARIALRASSFTDDQERTRYLASVERSRYFSSLSPEQRDRVQLRKKLEACATEADQAELLTRLEETKARRAAPQRLVLQLDQAAKEHKEEMVGRKRAFFQAKYHARGRPWTAHEEKDERHEWKQIVTREEEAVRVDMLRKLGTRTIEVGEVKGLLASLEASIRADEGKPVLQEQSG